MDVIEHPGKALPVPDAQVWLLDLHPEVHGAIADVIEAPTTARQVALQRAIHAFVAAARLHSGGEALGSIQPLLSALAALDRSTGCDEVQLAADQLRRAFFDVCHPLSAERAGHP